MQTCALCLQRYITFFLTSHRVNTVHVLVNNRRHVSPDQKNIVHVEQGIGSSPMLNYRERTVWCLLKLIGTFIQKRSLF